MCLSRNKITLFFLLIIFSCNSVKEVQFITPVDTKSKVIKLQEKQIFSLDEMEVYATNNFDGARLNDFKKLNDTTVVAFIKPENAPINNSAYYSFKIWSKTSRKINIKLNYPKEYKHRYIPKIKRTNTEWSPLAKELLIKENNNALIQLNISKDTTWVSAQELMTSKNTEQWYRKAIINKKFAHLASVGKSNLGRNIPVLDIYKGDKKEKPIIVLLTRQHPPEVTGFFAFQEFLTTILKENKLTTNFLNKYRILAFPIVNPDGVDLGHWRHNAGGIDTNRDWSKYNQPEIKQIVSFITKESKRNKSRIILGLDFHSTYKDVYYTNKIRKETALPTFIQNWFIALENNIPNYKVNEAAGNSTKPVSKGWFLYGHNAVGITYEIGDATPRDKIKLVGKVTAEEMMKILVKSFIH